MFGMRRRDFVALLGGAAAWPLAAGAQQSAMPVVGVLSSQSQESEAAVLASWGQALNESGYVSGRNVEFEYRFADGQLDRLSMLAAELLMWTASSKVRSPPTCRCNNRPSSSSSSISRPPNRSDSKFRRNCSQLLTS